MSENTTANNINTENTAFTLQYILEQFEKIQKELFASKEAIGVLHCVEDHDTEEDDNTIKVNEEVATKKVAAIVEVLHHREDALLKLIAFYEKVYDDLKNGALPAQK